MIPRIGSLASGARDAITDVDGVSLGHVTLDDDAVQTGVTVLRPHAGDPYQERVPAGFCVLNGFGKSIGLMQVEELGVLETPIALTNTFSVPAVAAAQLRQCVAANPECGREQPTVNPLVFECNDGYLNDTQRMAVTEAHYLKAWRDAGRDVAEGSVGAGRGMSCFGLKGGIGTASRRVPLGVATWTVGVLVLANFGLPGQLVMAGRPIDTRASVDAADTQQAGEKGSIIMLLATDAPLDARQLRRLSLRAGAGLARTGATFGHGSGDIALAFSTAYTLPQRVDSPMPGTVLLHDGRLDGLFQAAAEGVEQAILHALWHAEPVRGRDGHERRSLAQLLGHGYSTR